VLIATKGARGKGYDNIEVVVQVAEDHRPAPKRPSDTKERRDVNAAAELQRHYAPSRRSLLLLALIR
jgi:type III secretory pathway lipoprotein EscJ